MILILHIMEGSHILTEAMHGALGDYTAHKLLRVHFSKSFYSVEATPLPLKY